MKPLSRTNTINAIKMTREQNQPSILMNLLRFYMECPEDTKSTLQTLGRPKHYHKNSCEGCTIKLHGIL